MSLFRASRRSPALFALFASIVGTSDARADRACEVDPATSGRTCSMAECLTLQASVHSACKNPTPTSCTRISGCSPLKAERSRWLECYVARTTINSRCWSGGDAGHQRAAAQSIQNVSTCDARIALPRPVGCAAPCP
jgi:hypothetical protein